MQMRLINAQRQLYRRKRIKTALLYQRKLRRLGRLVYASLHIQVTMLGLMGTTDGMELPQKHQVLVTHDFHQINFSLNLGGKNTMSRGGIET